MPSYYFIHSQKITFQTLLLKVIMVQWLQCSLDPHFEVMVKNNEGYTYRNLLVPLIFFFYL